MDFDTPLTAAERNFIFQVQQRFRGIEDWQIAYIIRRVLSYLEALHHG